MTVAEVYEWIDYITETKFAYFSHDRQYRFFLKRQIMPKLGQELSGVSMMLGANPSVADEKRNDLTITKGITWGGMWDSEWFWMLNLHALVSTDPAVLTCHSDPIGQFNDRWIVQCANRADRVVCAYGDLGKLNDRGRQVEKMLKDAGLSEKLWCFGLTASGYPKHPSRIAYATPLVRYKI